MNKFVFLIILLSSLTSFAKSYNRFGCHVQLEDNSLISISGCLDSQDKFIGCKDEDKTKLGSPYITVSRIYFQRGRVVVPPHEIIYKIPAMYMTLNKTPENFKLKMEKNEIGALDLSIPYENAGERQVTLAFEGINLSVNYGTCLLR